MTRAQLFLAVVMGALFVALIVMAVIPDDLVRP